MEIVIQEDCSNGETCIGQYLVKDICMLDSETIAYLVECKNTPEIRYKNKIFED